MEFGIIIWLMFGIVSAVVASNKGRSGCGWFLLGVLLGPFGLILSLVVPKDESALERVAIEEKRVKKCPYCAEVIKAEAIVCRYCGKDLPRDRYDFRGIEWGINISELPDMVLQDDDGDSKWYHRKNDEMKIGDTAIDEITYGFYKNRFGIARVLFHGSFNFIKIMSVYSDHYGQGAKERAFIETYYWWGTAVNIRLDYKHRFSRWFNRQIHIRFWYLSIS